MENTSGNAAVEEILYGLLSELEAEEKIRAQATTLTNQDNAAPRIASVMPQEDSSHTAKLQDKATSPHSTFESKAEPELPDEHPDNHHDTISPVNNNEPGDSLASSCAMTPLYLANTDTTEATSLPPSQSTENLDDSTQDHGGSVNSEVRGHHLREEPLPDGAVLYPRTNSSDYRSLTDVVEEIQETPHHVQAPELVPGADEDEGQGPQEGCGTTQGSRDDPQGSLDMVNPSPCRCSPPEGPGANTIISGGVPDGYAGNDSVQIMDDDDKDKPSDESLSPWPTASTPSELAVANYLPSPLMSVAGAQEIWAPCSSAGIPCSSPGGDDQGQDFSVPHPMFESPAGCLTRDSNVLLATQDERSRNIADQLAKLQAESLILQQQSQALQEKALRIQQEVQAATVLRPIGGEVQDNRKAESLGPPLPPGGQRLGSLNWNIPTKGPVSPSKVQPFPGPPPPKPSPSLRDSSSGLGTLANASTPPAAPAITQPLEPHKAGLPQKTRQAPQGQSKTSPSQAKNLHLSPRKHRDGGQAKTETRDESQHSLAVAPFQVVPSVSSAPPQLPADISPQGEQKHSSDQPEGQPCGFPPKVQARHAAKHPPQPHITPAQSKKNSRVLMGAVAVKTTAKEDKLVVAKKPSHYDGGVQRQQGPQHDQLKDPRRVAPVQQGVKGPPQAAAPFMYPMPPWPQMGASYPAAFSQGYVPPPSGVPFPSFMAAAVQGKGPGMRGHQPGTVQAPSGGPLSIPLPFGFPMPYLDPMLMASMLGAPQFLQQASGGPRSPPTKQAGKGHSKSAPNGQHQGNHDIMLAGRKNMAPPQDWPEHYSMMNMMAAMQPRQDMLQRAQSIQALQRDHYKQVEQQVMNRINRVGVKKA